MLLFPWERARRRSCTPGTSWTADAARGASPRSAGILQVPDLPRSRSWSAAAIVRRRRGRLPRQPRPRARSCSSRCARWGPTMDTLRDGARRPALAYLHMDPPEPVALRQRRTACYDELPAAAIDALVEAAGPARARRLVSVELRHTGGALAPQRPRPRRAREPGRLALHVRGRHGPRRRHGRRRARGADRAGRGARCARTMPAPTSTSPSSQLDPAETFPDETLQPPAAGSLRATTRMGSSASNHEIARPQLGSIGPMRPDAREARSRLAARAGAGRRRRVCGRRQEEEQEAAARPLPLARQVRRLPEVDRRRRTPPRPRDQTAWNQDISQAPLDPNSGAIIANILANGGDDSPPRLRLARASTASPTPSSARSRRRPRSTSPPTATSPTTAPTACPLKALVEGGAGLRRRPPRAGGRPRALQAATSSTAPSRKKTPKPHWNADSGVIWNLRSAALRTEGFTSADAAGLPIFPGLARFDQAATGQHQPRASG